MFQSIKKIFGGGPQLDEDLSYDQAFQALESQAKRSRAELAERPDTPPEMLYFLAGDEKADIRVKVARNASTPMQANELLIEDPADEVRSELARKIARLLPDMQTTERDVIRERAISMLQRLADDKIAGVRAALSDTLKDSDLIPRSLAQKLAKDGNKIVCLPVLEYSPLLSDDDLIEVIAGSTAEGAIEKIARREKVSPNVSEAVAASLDVSAIAALLVNSNAQMREETLDKIIDQAETIEGLHQPLVLKSDLSLRAVRRISSFVVRALVEQLAERNDLPNDVKAHLQKQIEFKLEEETDVDHLGTDVKSLKKEFDKNGLTEDQLVQVAQKGNAVSIAYALHLVTKIDEKKIARIIDTQSAEGLVSLCWQADFAMRSAHEIQKGLHFKADKILLPRAGFDFPLSEEDMKWQLEYFQLLK
ncbi:MAG: DUF2336 domain-containing protein [Parvibaculaceae bacterium]|nr:DUF2336 domain-containing protein [Parvibaculaceae bacterium]